MNLRVSSPGQGHKSVSTWLLHWLGRKHVNISTKTSRPIREKTRTEDTMAHKNSFMHKQELENKPQLLWVNIVVSRSYLPRGNKRHSVPIQTLQNWGGLVKNIYIQKQSSLWDTGAGYDADVMGLLAFWKSERPFGHCHCQAKQRVVQYNFRFKCIDLLNYPTRVTSASLSPINLCMSLKSTHWKPHAWTAGKCKHHTDRPSSDRRPPHAFEFDLNYHGTNCL